MSLEKNRHHALVIDGDRSAALLLAREHIINILELVIEKNPDVTFAEHDRFRVDDARTLKERANHMPLGLRQVFVLAMYQATREAQNGLLKLLEEPPENTHFVLIIPTVEILLPTVRSRVQHLATVCGSLENFDDAKRFYGATVGARLEMVAAMVADKDRARTRVFFDTLEAYIHTIGVHATHQDLAEIAFVRRYLADTSSSLKMLVEHVAVSLSRYPKAP